MLQARKLRELREAARLTQRQMAELLDEVEGTIAALESTAAPLDSDLLDRCARAFGMTVERLLSDDATKAPALLLFRSLNSEVISELRARRAHFGLGDFLRSAWDLAELAALRVRKGAEASTLPGEIDGTPQAVPDSDSELYRQAEALADQTRSRLELGEAPVPSMLELLETRLRVPILWSTPDEVDPNIDGASTREPMPAILVNLVGGRDCWWRTRMTLAHELCHLLFDALPDTQHRRMVIFSPHPDPSRHGAGRSHRLYALPDTLERMERRANAFAAHFLAPGRVIRTLVSRSDATSEKAITLLCQHFGIGRLAAINQLTNVFVLSRHERARMSDRGGDDSLPPDHPDANIPRGRAPRCKTMHAWIDEALSRGWLSQVRARDYLGRSATEPLPWNTLPHQHQAPVVSEAAAVRLRVYAYLGQRDLTVRWMVDEPVADGGRWRARVFDIGRDGERRNRGEVVLTRAREVVAAETRLDLAAS
jgi:transcriptional regulator with XRE-family HTH domain/Zn-dependent peptidase ImmA (M78 family)